MDSDKSTKGKAVRRSQVVDLSRQGVSSSSKISNMAELGRMSVEELNARKIIYSGTPNKPLLNAFREIRTQLIKRSKSKNFVAMVTSLCNDAGTSFAVTNLGAVLALDKTKTALLIDCNLYEPSLDGLLNVEPDYGLTDYLADDELDINDIIYATGIPRLRVIPVGTHIEAGAEYFSSNRMVECLVSLKQRYPDRYIILDVPPIGLWAEARILVELSDLAVLVLPYGKVNENQVDAAIDAIGEDKIAGIVFNN